MVPWNAERRRRAARVDRGRRAAPAGHARVVPVGDGLGRAPLLHRSLGGLARRGGRQRRKPRVLAVPGRGRARGARGERPGRLPAGVHQRQPGGGRVRAFEQAPLLAERMAESVRRAGRGALRLREDAPPRRVQRRREEPDGGYFGRRARRGPRLGPAKDERPAPEPARRRARPRHRRPCESCTNEYGVYDMVGNLHEWTSLPTRNTVPGGLLPRHVDQRRGMRVPDHGARLRVPRLLDRLRCCADPGSASVSRLRWPGHAGGRDRAGGGGHHRPTHAAFALRSTSSSPKLTSRMVFENRAPSFSYATSRSATRTPPSLRPRPTSTTRPVPVPRRDGASIRRRNRRADKLSAAGQALDGQHREAPRSPRDAQRIGELSPTRWRHIARAKRTRHAPCSSPRSASSRRRAETRGARG